jgi:DNA-binding transcriptional regulator YiaG
LINRRQLLQRDPPVRWAEVIESLRKAGFSTSEIALALNVPRSTVWSWENGSVPNYEDGRALLKMLEPKITTIKLAVITAPMAMLHG